MGFCQELEVLGCLGLLLVEVVSAEAGVALMDEDQCLLTCNSLAYLKLACGSWVNKSTKSRVRSTIGKTKCCTYKRAEQGFLQRGRR